MSLIVNIYYTGESGNARKFAEEMVSSGVVEQTRAGVDLKLYVDGAEL